MIRCSFVHMIRFLLIFGTLVNSLKEHRNNIDEDSNYGFSSSAQDSKSKNAFSTGRRGPVSPDSNRNLGSFFDSFLNEDRHLVQKEIPAHTLSSKKSAISQTEDIEESFLCGAYRAKFVVKQDSIIRTKESLAEGATFLLAPSDIHSNAECVQQCCSDVHCTLAVFDGKGRNSCYLFNCGKGNLCVFAEHSNYTSTLIRRLSGVNKEEERENELENLKGLGAMGAADELSRVGGASGPDVGGATAGDSSRGDAAPVRDATPPTTTPGDVVPTTTSTTVATTLAVTTAPAVHYVSLLQPCSQDDQCQDVNAVCDNVCICKPNMKPSFGKCADVEEARRCSRLEFACRSVVRGRYPHCIASYDRCDGIAQCPDGSDEVDCQGGGDNLSGGQGSSSRRRPIVEADHPPAAPAATSGPQPPPPSRPNGGEVAHDLSAAVGPETPRISPKKGNFIGHDQRGPDERNEAQPRVADGYHTSLAGYHNALAEMNSSPVEKTSSPNDAERVAKVDAVQTKPVVEPDAAPKPVVAAPTAPVRTNISPATRRPDVAKPLASVDGAPGPIIVSKIEIDSASGGQLENAEAETTFLEYSGDLQGAIIALALGLSITAVLLVFVVCKLRNVKRRLRRGRLASHDADYLINGMYL